MNGLMFYLEMAGTVAFAISGAMLAIEKKFDIFGILAMGIITAVGGGAVRDIIIGATPPVMFSDPRYCIVAAVSSVLLFIPFVRRLLAQKSIHDAVLIVVDSLGLASFTVAGAVYTYQCGFNNKFLIIFVSVLTGVGGGVLRDLLAGEKPYIFKKHIYACASLAGAIFVAYLYNVIDNDIVIISGIALIFAIRMVAAVFKINLPHIGQNEQV